RPAPRGGPQARGWTTGPGAPGAPERHGDAAAREAGDGRGPLGLDVDDDPRAPLIRPEPLTHGLRQAHGLRPDADPRPRNASPTLQLVQHVVHGRGRDGDLEVPRRSRGRHTDDAPARIDQGTARKAGVEREIEAEPIAALGSPASPVPDGADQTPARARTTADREHD